MYLIYDSHPFSPASTTADAEPASDWAAMLAAVEDRTGRSDVLTRFPSVRRKLREGNRCAYIAPRRGNGRHGCWVVAA